MVTEATKLMRELLACILAAWVGLSCVVPPYKVAENFSDKVRIDFAVPAGRLKTCVIANVMLRTVRKYVVM